MKYNKRYADGGNLLVVWIACHTPMRIRLESDPSLTMSLFLFEVRIGDDIVTYYLYTRIAQRSWLFNYLQKVYQVRKTGRVLNILEQV